MRTFTGHWPDARSRHWIANPDLNLICHPCPPLASVTLIALLTAIFALLASVLGAVRDIVVELPKNFFGLCSGSSNGVLNSSGVLPLTDWLHDFIQSLLDRPLDQPVTFGDLWQNGGNEDSDREIELVLTATNITRGVSHRLPFLEGGWGQLFFKEEDLAQLFPLHIVSWMKSHAQEPRIKAIELAQGYYGLPRPADLPIVFGARMSASLPLILSAVPLYAPRATIDGKNSSGTLLVRRWGHHEQFPHSFVRCAGSGTADVCYQRGAKQR